MNTVRGEGHIIGDVIKRIDQVFLTVGGIISLVVKFAVAGVAHPVAAVNHDVIEKIKVLLLRKVLVLNIKRKSDDGILLLIGKESEIAVAEGIEISVGNGL